MKKKNIQHVQGRSKLMVRCTCGRFLDAKIQPPPPGEGGGGVAEANSKDVQLRDGLLIKIR